MKPELDATPIAVGNRGWTDRYEEFSIFLQLQNPYEYYWLINFGGGGVILTGWLGVLLGNDSHY